MECGESAGLSCENGSLSPVADRGAGSTGLSRRTCHSHLPGKCRVFLRKRCTFPRGGCGTGSTCLSRRTCSLSLPGKCRTFPRKRFTFPRGSQGHRLHMPLSPHLQSLPPGKVPGFSAKMVHFPPRHETSGEVQQSLLGKVPSIQAL